MSGSQLLAAPGLVGAVSPPEQELIYLFLFVGGILLAAAYLCGCCSGAATVLACFRARKRPHPQGKAESPARRRQKQAEEGAKISPLREGFLSGPRARKDGADRR